MYDVIAEPPSSSFSQSEPVSSAPSSPPALPIKSVTTRNIESIVLYPLGVKSRYYPNVAADEQLVEIKYHRNCRMKPEMITALYDHAKISHEVTIAQALSHNPKPGAELVDIGIENTLQFILRAKGEQSCKVQVRNLLGTLTAIGAIDPHDKRLDPKDIRHLVQPADVQGFIGGAGI